MKKLKVKSILFSLLAMMAFTVFLTSCEQEVLTTETIETFSLNQSESMVDLFKVAESLSKSVQNDESILPALEDFCLQSEEKGHSDVEFFYHIEKDVAFGGSSNTLSKVVESSEQLRSDATVELCNIPGLAFLLEGNLDATTYSKRIYVDDGFDDSDANAHIKYYENGVLGSHPISEVPDAKAFVVRISEAYVSTEDDRYGFHQSIPGALKEIGKTDCEKSITVLDRKLESVDLTESQGEDENSLDMRMCDRDNTNNRTENLRWFRTTNDYEGWRGKGEFFWLIIFADDINYQLEDGAVEVTGDAMGYINTGQFGGVKENTWYAPNYSSIIWDLDDDGNRMKYVAYEADGGSIRTIDVELSTEFDPPVVGSTEISTTIPITINNGDDFIGETIVEYCHDMYQNSSDWGFQYRYGAVTMLINNR